MVHDSLVAIVFECPLLFYVYNILGWPQFATAVPGLLEELARRMVRRKNVWRLVSLCTCCHNWYSHFQQWGRVLASQERLRSPMAAGQDLQEPQLLMLILSISTPPCWYKNDGACVSWYLLTCRQQPLWLCLMTPRMLGWEEKMDRKEWASKAV